MVLCAASLIFAPSLLLLNMAGNCPDREGSLIQSWQPFTGRGSDCLQDVCFAGDKLLALSSRGTVQRLSVSVPDSLYLAAQVCCVSFQLLVCLMQVLHACLRPIFAELSLVQYRKLAEVVHTACVQAHHSRAQWLAYSEDTSLLAVLGDASQRATTATVSLWQLPAKDSPQHLCSWGSKPWGSWLKALAPSSKLNMSAQFSAGGRQLLVHAPAQPLLVLSVEVRPPINAIHVAMHMGSVNAAVHHMASADVAACRQAYSRRGAQTSVAAMPAEGQNWPWHPLMSQHWSPMLLQPQKLDKAWVEVVCWCTCTSMMFLQAGARNLELSCRRMKVSSICSNSTWAPKRFPPPMQPGGARSLSP